MQKQLHISELVLISFFGDGLRNFWMAENVLSWWGSAFQEVEDGMICFKTEMLIKSGILTELTK